MIHDLSEYQTSALQRLYTPGILIWSRNVVHNQSYFPAVYNSASGHM